MKKIKINGKNLHKYLDKYVYFIIAVLTVLALLTRLRGFSAPLYDAYYFRQTQTATVARNFYTNGINLFRPQLDIFGTGPEQYLILESPIYQAVVAYLSQFWGFSESIARSVSIASGLISGLCLYFIVLFINKNKLLALLSLIFFWFFPLSIFVERAVLIESFVVMMHLVTLLIWIILLRNTKIWLFLVAVIITILAIISKIIYAPTLLLFMGLIGLYEDGKKIFRRPEVWVFFISVIAAVFYWQTTADRLNILSNQPLFASQNKEYLLWNTGTLMERFSLHAWTDRIRDILGSVTKLGIVTVVLGIFWGIKNRNKAFVLWLGWLAVMFLEYIFFFRIQSHNYYFLVVLPALAVFAAYGIYGLGLWLGKISGKTVSFLVVLLILGYFMFKGSQNAWGYFVIHQDVERKIDITNRYLTKPGNIIFVFPQSDWNSVYTYYTHRKGIVMTLPGLGNIATYKYRGYAYVVFQDFDTGKINQSLLEKYHLSLIHEDKEVVAEFAD